MTVPFIMSLALGVTLLRKNTLASNEEGFGLIGVVSVGPIASRSYCWICSGMTSPLQRKYKLRYLPRKIYWGRSWTKCRSQPKKC